MPAGRRPLPEISNHVLHGQNVSKGEVLHDRLSALGLNSAPNEDGSVYQLGSALSPNVERRGILAIRSNFPNASDLWCASWSMLVSRKYR